MTENIKDLIKPVVKNIELINHKITDQSFESLKYHCSTFIEKEKILVKGQCYNRENSRRALLVFFDLQTGKVLGGYKLFLLTLTKRVGRDLEL